MFDVGFAEIFLLALIGLLVLGPERLPGVARTIGGFVRKARMSWISLRNTIEAEMAESDISAPIKKTSEELKKIGRDLAESPAFKSVNSKFPTPETDPKAESESESVDAPKPDLLQETRHRKI